MAIQGRNSLKNNTSLQTELSSLSQDIKRTAINYSFWIALSFVFLILNIFFKDPSKVRFDSPLWSISFWLLIIVAWGALKLARKNINIYIKYRPNLPQLVMYLSIFLLLLVFGSFILLYYEKLISASILMVINFIYLLVFAVISVELLQLDFLFETTTAEILKKITELSDKKKNIFMHFKICALTLYLSLIEMNRIKELEFEIGPKNITHENIYSFCTIILAYFAFFYGKIKKHIEADLKKCVIEVTKKPELIKEIYTLLQKHYSKSDPKINLPIHTGLIWGKIVDTFKCGNKSHPIQLVYFQENLVIVFKDVIKNIEDDLKTKIG